MAIRIPQGMSQSSYTGHGDSLLDWTPPDVQWMAPSQQMYGRSSRIINPTYRLISSKGGLPSKHQTKNGNDDLPDEGHTFVYPIYHWGNPPGETINRYLASNVQPDINPSNIGWTDIYWPTYTTNPNLYPHYSAIEDPYDLKEGKEGKSLYQILVGRTQIPTEQVKDEDWFNLR
tara:strand:+ start:7023 stop:7544 length:522 start_codon:yes stop_codon:yes gene_type:complete